MADGLKSTCVVQDPLGQKCNVSVYFEPGIFGNWFDKSDALKTLIEAYSECKVAKRSDSYAATLPNVPIGAVTTPYGTVDQKAIIILRESWTGKTRKIEIPGPKASMFTTVLEQGFRVTPLAGNDIATAYSGMLSAGKSVGFVRGWLKGKK